MECGRMEDDFMSFSFPFIHSLLVRPTYLKGTGYYRDKVWVTCGEKVL